eukprot:s2742_g12.t4
MLEPLDEDLLIISRIKGLRSKNAHVQAQTSKMREILADWQEHQERESEQKLQRRRRTVKVLEKFLRSQKTAFAAWRSYVQEQKRQKRQLHQEEQQTALQDLRESKGLQRLVIYLWRCSMLQEKLTCLVDERDQASANACKAHQLVGLHQSGCNASTAATCGGGSTCCTDLGGQAAFDCRPESQEMGRKRQVTTALDCGYRVIDTAQRYGNEEGIGRALSAAFAEGRVKRDEVFVTTKVWPANYGYKKTIESVKESAKKLGLESIDLVLPHWPGIGTEIELAQQNAILRQQTWKALEDLQRETRRETCNDGLVKQIGVSNYNERHLGELLDYAEIRPMASQFEIHPFNTREKLVQMCQDLGIRVNGYSPLGGKGNPNQVTDQLLQMPFLEEMASVYGKTPAQLILRWHLQRDTTPIPKASSKARLAENIDVFNFQLSDADMKEILAHQLQLNSMRLRLLKERRSHQLADTRATLAGLQVLGAHLPFGVAPCATTSELTALSFCAWHLHTAMMSGRDPWAKQGKATLRLSAETSSALQLSCRIARRMALQCLAAWREFRAQLGQPASQRARSSRLKESPNAKSLKKETAPHAKECRWHLLQAFLNWRCVSVTLLCERRVRQEAKAAASECAALQLQVDHWRHQCKEASERSVTTPSPATTSHVLLAWRFVSLEARQRALRAQRCVAKVFTAWTVVIRDADRHEDLILGTKDECEKKSKRSGSGKETAVLRLMFLALQMNAQAHRAEREGFFRQSSGEPSPKILVGPKMLGAPDLKDIFLAWRSCQEHSTGEEMCKETWDSMAAFCESMALEQVGGGFLAGVQNAAGVVMEALQDDGVSEESDPVRKRAVGMMKTLFEELYKSFKRTLKELSESFFATFRRHHWFQHKSYVHHSHITVKMVGVFVAVALIVISILDIFGIARDPADAKPFHYVHNVWNIFFGVLMIFMDAPAKWLGKGASWQTALWQKAPSLGKARGRALVHFYVGVINLAMVNWTPFTLIVNLARGGSLVVCAVIMLLNHHTYHCQRRSHVRRNFNGAQAAAKASEALHEFQEEALEVRSYIAKNHCTTRIVSFLAAIALIVISILGMINVLGALFSPFHYVIGIFNFFWAIIIALIDGEASWFAKCGNCRVSLFQWFPVFATLPGRSMLHFYVGSINVVMLPGGFMDVLYAGHQPGLCASAQGGFSTSQSAPMPLCEQMETSFEPSVKRVTAAGPTPGDKWSFSQFNAFSIPCFLAGLTVGVLLTVTAFGFLTDRLSFPAVTAEKRGSLEIDGETSETTQATAGEREPKDPKEDHQVEQIEYRVEESLHLFWPRCTWLVAMLLVQSLSSLILDSFSGLMQRHMSLAFFLTMLVGLGGNAGGQSVVLTVRRLALGNTVKVSEQFHVGLLLVLVMAPLAFVRALLQQTTWRESLAVGASAAVITVVATVVGTALPKLLWFFQVDPAHGAVGVQVLMDLAGIAIVCCLGYLFLESSLAKCAAANPAGPLPPVIGSLHLQGNPMRDPVFEKAVFDTNLSVDSPETVDDSPGSAGWTSSMSIVGEQSGARGSPSALSPAMCWPDQLDFPCSARIVEKPSN